MAQQRRLTHEKLTALFENEEIPGLPLLNEKYVIFSDLHLGHGKEADDFHDNEPAMLDALRKYRSDGFSLILLGDIEDFWQFTPEETIGRYDKTVYRAIRDFGDKKVFRIFGNHDMEWRQLYDPTKSGQTAPGNSSESLKLLDKNGMTKFMLVHGHQGDSTSDTGSWKSRFAVRCFRCIEPMAKFFGITAHPPALRSQVTGDYEKVYYDWAKQKAVSIICGHSHNAIFASKSYFQRCREKVAQLADEMSAGKGNKGLAEAKQGEIDRLLKEIKAEKKRNLDIDDLDAPGQVEPCYYNTGCALFSDGITGIEISDDEIRLVKWERDRNADPNYSIYQRGPI